MSIIFAILMLITTNIFSIQLFPSGISVSFESPSKPNWKSILLQPEELRKEKSLKTDRIIRVINGITDIPNKTFLGLVFYNKKNKVVGYQIITNSEKPLVNNIFFIDRNTGRNFQGKLDIYAIPKKAESFALAFVNKRGKVLKQNFTHPDFEEDNKISLDTLYNLPSTKNIMLQYEVIGTFEQPNVKLAAFHFVK